MVPVARWTMRQTLPSSAIATRPWPPDDLARAGVGQAHDGAVRTQQLPGVTGDRVEDVVQISPAGELERDLVQRGALPFPAMQVRDRECQLGSARDLARDVGERGGRDVGIDRRVDHDAEVADPVAAPDQRQVQDAGVELRAACERGGVLFRVCRLVEQRSEPAQARRKRVRPADGQRVSARDQDRDRAGDGARLRHEPVERLAEQVRQGQAATDGGAHGVGDGEVLVPRQQLLLSAVEVDRDEGREDHDRAAHDHRGQDVGVVAGDGPIEEQEPDHLEGPDEHDGHDHRRPLEAVEIARALRFAHGFDCAVRYMRRRRAVRPVHGGTHRHPTA